MLTYLIVKLALLPAILFWTFSGLGWGEEWALLLPLALAVPLSGRALWSGQVRPLELAFLAFLLATSLFWALGYPLGRVALPLSFVVMGLAGLASVMAGRPWTADYSASSFAEASKTKAFLAINAFLSGLWSVIFLVFALLAAFQVSSWWTTGLTLVGALISIFGPKAMVSYKIRGMIKARESYHWADPDFAKPLPTGHYDIAVIGAGLGGLTAAALLAKAGLKVFVADQHVVPGGYSHSWLRKAKVAGQSLLFRFDSGVHDFSGVREGGPVTGVLKAVGAEVEWLALPQAVFEGGRLTEVPEDWHDHVRQLGERFPASAEGIAAFFETTYALYQAMFATARDHCGVPFPPDTVEDMLAFPKTYPDATRWMDTRFVDYLAYFVKEPEARAALCQLTGYLTDDVSQLGTFEMIPIYGYNFYGGFYPKGGSGRLGEVLAEAVTKAGGTVQLKTPVERILVENGRACGLKLEHGEEVRARAVISNADLIRTFRDLVPQGAIPDAERQRFATAEPATSAFMVHLGLNRAPDVAPMTSLKGGKGHLSMAMVSPSLIDPGAAPEGYHTLELITLVSQSEAKVWFPRPDSVDDKAYRFSDAYKEAKEAVAEKMISSAEAALPGLRNSIVLKTEASPLTFARYDHASGGSIYGVAKKDRVIGSRSPLPGLYWAGAMNMGAGVEAVMISGARAAERIKPGLLKRLNG